MKCNLFEIKDRIFGSEDSSKEGEVRSGFSSSDKWWASIIAGILFAVFSSTVVYGLTSTAFSWVGLPPLFISGGGPTLLGLLVHTVVFTLVIRLLMA